MFKDYRILAERLSDVEKINIRAASEDRLVWLYENFYSHEIDLGRDEGIKMLKQVQRYVNEKFLEKSSSTGFP